MREEITRAESVLSEERNKQGEEKRANIYGGVRVSPPGVRASDLRVRA